MAAESGPPQLGMLQSLMLFKERPDIINSTGIELSTTGSGRDRHEGNTRSLEQEQEENLLLLRRRGRVPALDVRRETHGYFDQAFMLKTSTSDGAHACLAGPRATYRAQSSFTAGTAARSDTDGPG